MDLSAISGTMVDSTIQNAKFSKVEKEANEFKSALEKASENVKTNGTEEDDKALKDMCKEFEKYFLQEMYKSMKSTLNQDNNLFYGGQSEEIFSDLLDQQYVDAAVDAGGIGLAKQLYEQLKSPTSSTGAEMANKEKEYEEEKNTLDVNEINNK